MMDNMMIKLKFVENYAMAYYPHVINLNLYNEKFTVEELIDFPCRFFVIKAADFDNIHKAIKYGIWTCSSGSTLSETYAQLKSKNGRLYFFFSANKSSKFCGLAEMTSTYDKNRSFPLWSGEGRNHKGCFDIRWIFVKEVKFEKFQDIKIRVKDEELPVVRSKNLQEIPLSDALKMVEIIRDYEFNFTVFEQFPYLDNIERSVIDYLQKNMLKQQEKEKLKQQEKEKEMEKEKEKEKETQESEEGQDL